MTKKNVPKAMSPNGQRSCSVFTTKIICMITYTNSSIPGTRYSTTNSPTVFVGPSPAQLLKVASETRKVMANMAKQALRRSHTESLVPSSYSWKPTKPLISKQAASAEVSPLWTAVK